MPNMLIRTPRFYPDTINYLLNRGVAQSEYAVTATDAGAYFMGTFTTGSAAELFDMKPLNKCTFDTSADTDGHVLITIDLQQAYTTDYIAILNHNIKSAVGKIRIFAGDESTDITALDGGNADTGDINWGSVTVTEVLDADTITAGSDNKSVVIEPGTDGSTIIRFTEQTERYWAIQLEGNTTNTGNATDGTWGTTDVFVGCIMVGEYFEMPHAPDLSVKRSIIFDKNKIQESVGGQRYSNMTTHGRQVSSTTISPFSLFLFGPQDPYGGRITYDMNFSFLNANKIMPSAHFYWLSTQDVVFEDLWHKTHGSHTPFIFSIDKDSEGNNAESEHIFARFAQPSLDMTQVANDVFNVSMRIEEEF